MENKYLFNPGLIIVYIKEHNLTKEVFCKQCKITVAQLERMYNCDISVGVEEWLKVAEFINVNPINLIKQINL